MTIATSILKVILMVISVLAALGSVLLFVRLQWPAPFLWMLKLFASALSWWMILAGVVSFILGLVTGSAFLWSLGAYNTIVFALHIFLVSQGPAAASGFETAFGQHWEDSIAPATTKHFLHSRLGFTLPRTEEALLHQNMSFASPPDTGQQVLFDLWQPPSNVHRSGIAFLYFHGGAWYMLDKDLGTRPFFNHLASQGHVVMDVAYRKAPETDMMGMVHDVKRSIAWMKAHANAYGVNPDRIILGGGSSGGHLALMAAYTTEDIRFTPGELNGQDLHVRGVVSVYGPADLAMMYYHTNQQKTTLSLPLTQTTPPEQEMPDWMVKAMGNAYYRLHFDKGFTRSGAFAPLLGGHPDEIPDVYAFYSPVTHVHPGCPPTLLLHGRHDVMAPVKATEQLYTRLQQANVKTAMHLFPQSDHAFDLIMSSAAPGPRSAIYDIERFLAVMQ